MASGVSEAYLSKRTTIRTTVTVMCECVPRTALYTSACTYISQQPQVVGMVLPILQMREVGLGEVQPLTRRHVTGTW